MIYPPYETFKAGLLHLVNSGPSYAQLGNYFMMWNNYDNGQWVLSVSPEDHKDFMDLLETIHGSAKLEGHLDGELFEMRQKWGYKGWYCRTRDSFWEITYNEYGRSPRKYPISKFPTELSAWAEFEKEEL
jgi:hypothetical protein